MVIPAMLSKAELATAMPKAGGDYFCTDRSMGAGFGTLAGFAPEGRYIGRHGTHPPQIMSSVGAAREHGEAFSNIGDIVHAAPPGLLL